MARLRDIFSRNLRDACCKRGAVARMAEATGISPVQLNRYLNGTLPNERNLGKIATFLKVEEHTLFQEERRSAAAGFRDFIEAAKRSAVTDQVEHMERRRALLLYFEIPNQPNYVVRSTVALSVSGGIRTFRRFTDVQQTTNSTRVATPNEHNGIVSELGDELYLTAFNSSEPFEPSMVTLRGLERGRVLSVGRSMVLTMDGPQSLKVVGQHIWSPIAIGELRAQAGVVALDSLFPPHAVRRLLADDVPIELVTTS